MVDVRQTETFKAWLKGLKDQKAKGIIVSRLARVAQGNLGDVEPAGEGVSELRIHFGPGYRLYLVERGNTVVVLLCGGTKRTQSRDIDRAKAMAKDLDL
jgi:putative addiction module killer protein